MQERIGVSYQTLKTIMLNKGTTFQYTVTTSKYDIWVADGGVNFAAEVWQAGYEEPQVNVTQNTIDRTDFVTNWLAGANQRKEVDQPMTGTITNATSTVVATVSGSNGVTVTVNGTYAGVNFTFEGSDDGTIYYPLLATRSDESAEEGSTGVLPANTSRMWHCYFGDLLNFRVRATAWTSGTANIRISNALEYASKTAWIHSSNSTPLSENLTQVGGSSITLGQTTMANSLPVTVASNQSNLNIVGILTNNNAAPAANNIGALVAVANSTPPTYTAGDQVLLQTDLNGNIKIVGGVASGSADSGNPVKIGGVATTSTIPTTVTSGQRVNAMYDSMGRMIVNDGMPRQLVSQGTVTLTASTTETTLIAAAGAGIFLDMVAILITNTSATATKISVRDSTGGTIRQTYNLPASGQVSLSFPVAWIQATANNNWTVQSGTSVSSVVVSALFEQTSN